MRRLSAMRKELPGKKHFLRRQDFPFRQGMFRVRLLRFQLSYRRDKKRNTQFYESQRQIRFQQRSVESPGS